MVALMHVAGGVALLIFGIRFLNKGLDRVFGDRLALWLSRATGGRFRAAAFGIGLAIAAPSSTTLSLLSISLVQAGKLAFVQAMAVMFGANIGITTITYLIAFDIYEHAPILFLVGVSMFLFGQRSRIRGIGQIALSLGLIFTGVGIIKNTTAPLTGSDDLQQLLSIVSHYPLLITAVAAGLTVLFQSSTATMALVLGLSFSGAIDMSIALPMILGANVGISLTTTIAGWTDISSRRLGVGMFACRALLASVLLSVLTFIVAWLATLPIDANWQIALLSTAFNILAAVIWIPLLGFVAAALARAIPERQRQPGEEDVTYLDSRWAHDPHVAFTQTKREIAHMAHLVLQMLEDFWVALKSEDERLCYELRRRDDRIDRLDRQIKLYLTQQIAESLTNEQAASRISQLRFLGDLESIGDVIDRNLVDVALKKLRKGVRFSEQGWDELKGFIDKVIQQIDLATAAFVSDDPQLARQLLRKKDIIRDEEIALREAHYRRLQRGQTASIETTELHLELLTQLKHMAHMASGVAYSVLDGNGLSTARNGAGSFRGRATPGDDDEADDAPI